MSEPREVPSNVPPDWRDWIDSFPSIKSIALFCVFAWIVTGALIGGANLWGYLTAHEPTSGVIRVLEIWLDALNWLTAAAVFGVVGKRATEKPDLVRAEGEVKAKAVVAAAQAAAIAPTAGASPEAPVLTQADAQRAAEALEATQRKLADPVGASVEGEGD